MAEKSNRLDLSPAKWIWIPSQRTLPNTFVLFRKEIEVSDDIKTAKGWILADSRYCLWINGERIQWGPGPADPRWPEADYLDITAYLKAGKNVIGVEVLFYGHGDGTWVTGKPGLLFKLEVYPQNGHMLNIVSDGSWECCIDRAHRPGQYKRWYLRALQEEFDSRLYPYGWNTIDYMKDELWLAAMVLDCGADKPSICSCYQDYLTDCGFDGKSDVYIRKRQIPLIKEILVEPVRINGRGRLEWLRNPDDWFEMRIPGSFTIHRECKLEEPYGRVGLHRFDEHNQAHYITYEFEEQMVGWPFFEVYADEGTIIELICQESNDPTKADWLDTHRFTWTRLICRQGLNRFETFDYESLRWLQLHIRSCGEVQILKVGIRRRLYNWKNEPKVKCGEPKLQRLFGACINTIYNNVNETMVDGMGRERQQYSGDIGHELHAVRYAFGEAAVSERFIRTFGDGMTHEGYFMDCWPAFDRMVRIPQREVGLTLWGPMLDHSIQFVFDCWNHYEETGGSEVIKEVMPRLLKFAAYLEKLRKEDGLLPVENLGVTTVWMDTDAYKKQQHKECSFNLYAAAMYRYPLASLCEITGIGDAGYYRAFADNLLEFTAKKYWDEQRKTYVANLPWVIEENEIRYCDRSLSLALLFDLCPNNSIEASLRILAESPEEMGISYPPNAGWRFRALAKYGRCDIIVDELRGKWANIRSVILNNSMPEGWVPSSDDSTQWSHASVAPLYVLFMEIAGIKPLKPGFEEILIRPQLHDINDLKVTAYTVKGELTFEALRDGDEYSLSIGVPQCKKAILRLPEGCLCDIESYGEAQCEGFSDYILNAGTVNVFRVKDR